MCGEIRNCYLFQTYIECGYSRMRTCSEIERVEDEDGG